MKKHVKRVGVVLFLAALVLGYFYYLSNKQPDEKTEIPVIATAVQDVILRNLDIQYPPTPRELVKYYAEITKCLYSEIYTDEELLAMIDKLRVLFDADLLVNNPLEAHTSELKNSIALMKESDYSIPLYIVSESTEVIYYEYGGYECASLHCVFNVRMGMTVMPSDHEFILRKDEEGRWKILGWELIPNDE